MNILKIVSRSPLWGSPDYCNAICQTDFETYTSRITLFNGTDDKEGFSSSILHPRDRFLNQQRDKYFCPLLIQEVDSALWKFTKFEASKLGKTFPQRNLVPS